MPSTPQSIPTARNASSIGIPILLVSLLQRMQAIITRESSSRIKFMFRSFLGMLGGNQSSGSVFFSCVVVAATAATSAAPWAFSSAAHRFMVLPVVRTSSQSRMRQPFSETVPAENCPVFSRRCAADKVCCCRPVPLSCKRSFRYGIRVMAATSFARTAAGLQQRFNCLRLDIGTGATIS